MIFFASSFPSENQFDSEILWSEQRREVVRFFYANNVAIHVENAITLLTLYTPRGGGWVGLGFQFVLLMTCCGMIFHIQSWMLGSLDA